MSNHTENTDAWRNQAAFDKISEMTQCWADNQCLLNHDGDNRDINASVRNNASADFGRWHIHVLFLKKKFFCLGSNFT